MKKTIILIIMMAASSPLLQAEKDISFFLRNFGLDNVLLLDITQLVDIGNRSPDFSFTELAYAESASTRNTLQIVGGVIGFFVGGLFFEYALMVGAPVSSQYPSLRAKDSGNILQHIGGWIFAGGIFGLGGMMVGDQFYNIIIR